MKRTLWTLSLMTGAALFFIVSTGCLAAENIDEHSRIETFGVVSNENPQAGTITITVDKTSRDLQDKFGKNVTFHAGNTMRIDTCSAMKHEMTKCWTQLSENLGMQSREAERGEQAELSQIKKGDWVFISGYFDKDSNHYVVDEILKWRKS